MKTIFAALALSLTAAGAKADPAGLRLAEIEMPHHAETAAVAVWYPSGGAGDPAVFGENAVFFGVDVLIGADLAEGQYPVVLLSHGTGGTFRAMSWLASGLAERGAIVAGVNHPNSNWRDFDMRDGIKHWARAHDLSAVLDELLGNPLYQDHIDTSRIMATGFSFGGWTALSMGGVTGNLSGTVSACRRYYATMSLCDTFLSEEVNMQGISPGLWNTSYADARVTHIAAIDPGFVWGLEESNIEGLSADTSYESNPGFHFTAMPLCKSEAEAILKEENDDPVCTDPEGTDRAAVHTAIIDMMADQLGL